METYPIAGQLLEQKFLFGISIRDLVDVFSIPFVFVGVTAFAGVSESTYLWFGGVGFIVSIIILYQTPAAQRPRHWVPAYLSYHIGSTTYLNRPVERDSSRGSIQDVVLTWGDEEDGPSST